MDADQRVGGRVVEARAAPPRRVDRPVTRLARRREARLCMVRAAGRLVGGLVAVEAVHPRVDELAVAVTVVAAQHLVRKVERIPGSRGVVPLDRRPGRGAVTLLALGSQARLVRVVLPPHPVTVHAPVGRAFGHALDVAARARDREVPAVEGECAPLVEGARHRRPAFGLVTRLAGRPEGAAVNVLTRVTRRARRAEPGIAHGRGATARELALLGRVTGAAGERRVRAGEEPVEAGGPVRVRCQLERLARVTRLAPLAELREVHVLVARRAVGWCSAEDDRCRLRPLRASGTRRGSRGRPELRCRG